MTDRELADRLAVILQRALVEIRTLSRIEAGQQIHDLADAVEFLPTLQFVSFESQRRMVQSALRQYEAKYPTSAGRYTVILDLDEADFQRLYRPEPNAWDGSPVAEGLEAQPVS